MTPGLGPAETSPGADGGHARGGHGTRRDPQASASGKSAVPRRGRFHGGKRCRGNDPSAVPSGQAVRWTGRRTCTRPTGADCPRHRPPFPSVPPPFSITVEGRGEEGRMQKETPLSLQRPAPAPSLRPTSGLRAGRGGSQVAVSRQEARRVPATGAAPWRPRVSLSRALSSGFGVRAPRTAPGRTQSRSRKDGPPGSPCTRRR